MIEVSGLRKQYGDFLAVDDVSFTAAPGEVFGLLGPNGAGKSTAIGCISGLLVPSGGSVRVMGHDVVRDAKAAKAGLGVVPQELALYEDLSPIQNLSYWGAAYGLRGEELRGRVEEVLEHIGLKDRESSPAKTFSGGMKRRLNFGCGIVHRPKVLLLDEPTVGVDPQSRVKLLDLVRAQVEQGMTVLYTTHYMEEAQELCARLAIMDHGKTIAIGTMEELREQLGEHDVLRLGGRFAEDAVRQALARVDNAEIVAVTADTLTLAVEGASQKLSSIFDALNVAGAEVRETTLHQPNLESLFIKLTGRELRQ